MIRGSRRRRLKALLATLPEQILIDVACTMKDTQDLNDSNKCIRIVENQIRRDDTHPHMRAEFIPLRTNVR
jgi:hypothetical protein